MTLVSDILLQAYRESNLVPISTPTLSTEQETEALARLNAIVASVLGWEAGAILQQWPVGRQGYKDPDTLNPDIWQDVPQNSILVLNLDQPETVYLPDKPSDGARIQVQDLAGNLSTNPLTIDANGRLIEGARSLVLNTDSLNKTWIYRADLGNWTVVSALASTDEMPFPPDFDDMFIILLAIRLNPRYGRELDPQSQLMLRRAQQSFMARYTQSWERELSPDLRYSPVKGTPRDWATSTSLLE